jgi:hypothetical protein
LQVSLSSFFLPPSGKFRSRLFTRRVKAEYALPGLYPFLDEVLEDRLLESLVRDSLLNGASVLAWWQGLLNLL